MVPQKGLDLNPAVRRALWCVVASCGLFLSAYLPGVARRAGGPLPAPSPRPAGPPAKLVPDTVEHDFGLVYQGSTVDHVFVLRNEGPGAALVERTSTSCGCTATLLSESNIPVGGETRLKTSFSAGSRKGAFKKSISVFSNDPASPLTLYVKGTLAPLITIMPELVSFGDVKVGQKVKRTIVLRGTKPEVKMHPQAPSPRYMPLDVGTPKPGPGGTWTIELVARPDNSRQLLTGYLTVMTGNETVKQLNVRINGKVVR